MGLACSASLTEEEREARRNHKEIEKRLREEAKSAKGTIKLLLLGPSESGKSTLLKQFRLIYAETYTEEERKAFRPAIVSNVFQSLLMLLQACDALNIPIESEAALSSLDLVKSSPSTVRIGYEDASAELIQAIKAIWHDPGIQLAFESRSSFNIIDSAEYFLSDVDRVLKSNMLPTDQDILMTRVMTTNVSESTFVVDGSLFKVFDLGGHRSERRKWAQFFDDVDAIIFVVAISSYNQTLNEDRKVNRIREGLMLFEAITNHPLFEQTCVILFLNKMDLFQKRFLTSPISKYFPDYEGDDKDYKAGRAFFLEMFCDLTDKNDEDGTLYTHYTFATDTFQTRKLLYSVNSTIVQSNLQGVGML